MSEPEKIAIVGIGRMGSAIAERIEASGRPIAVWNRSPAATEPMRERGAAVLDRPCDAWKAASVCISALSDAAALEAVALGADGLLCGSPGADAVDADADAPDASAPRSGTSRVLIDMSTIDSPSSARIAQAAQRHGVAYLRAPVSGNPSVVRAGNLTIVVSGPRRSFDAQLVLLNAIGPNVFYVGEGERARIVKLALNLMLAGTAQLMSEALVLSERHGIERRDMLAVMGATAVGSPFVRYKADALAADDYTATFTAKLLHKDLSLALAAAEQAGVPVPLTALTDQLIQSCIALGMGDLDMMALLPRLRRDAGMQGPEEAQP